MPYYGPDVAAFTPMQEAGMQGAYDAAAAFGLAEKGGDALAGIPEAKDFGGGRMGYSSGDLFDQARAEFEGRSPQQASAFNAMFKPYGGGEPGAGFPADGSIPDPKQLTSNPAGTSPGGIPPVGTPEFAAWLQSQGFGGFPV